MSDFQIIIPMSGFGERFRKAGYSTPKPLIKVDGKPIIAHIIDLFPEEVNFLFICNQEHLDNPTYGLANILTQYCPSGIIIGIPPHKLGPVYAVLACERAISREKKVIVNYCDFSCLWSWKEFKKFVVANQCAGAIPAYKDFHPHSLGNTNYAYMLEKDGWVQDIQEKQPFTANRMQEYASSGTYYFSSGQLMLSAFKETIKNQLSLDGEFYVSLAYKSLLIKKLPVAIFPIKYFMQWGTPEDLRVYEEWSKIFQKLLKFNINTKKYGSIIMPMAGLGQRFLDEGYIKTKPLITVSGKSMVIQAINDLPQAKNYVFVLRADMPNVKSIQDEIFKYHSKATIEIIDKINDGQATTALIGLEALLKNQTVLGREIDELGPITIGTCDSGALYDRQAFDMLQRNPNIDVIVWGARGHANALRNPNMFSWISADCNGKIKEISVKNPLSHPDIDPIVTGTFTFRNAVDLQRVILSLKQRDGKVNSELYLDSCINDAITIGLHCQLFLVDHYISWGTPADLRTFEYWQNCFHLWQHHPYTLNADRRFNYQQTE